MTEAKIDLVTPSAPAPAPAPASVPEEYVFDMTLVKEASSFSKIGLTIGAGVLALLFVISFFNSPSEDLTFNADTSASTATEPAVENGVAAPAEEAAANAIEAAVSADVMTPAPIVSMEFPALADACNAADTPAAGGQCNELARKYDSGVEVKKDLLFASNTYLVGCAKGSMMACANAGLKLGDSSSNGVQMQPERSFELLKRACDAQVMHGCAELGYNYENGVGVARDKLRARQLYELACVKGWSKGCEYRDKLDQSGN